MYTQAGKYTVVLDTHSNASIRYISYTKREEGTSKYIYLDNTETGIKVLYIRVILMSEEGIQRTRE